MAFPAEISGSDLAALIGTSEKTVQRLTMKGVLRRTERGGFDARDAVQSFICHRESVVATEHGGGEYGRARAEWMLEKVRALRLKREREQGEWVRVSEVIATRSAVYAAICARLLAIPAKIAARLVMVRTPAQAMAIVRVAIVEAIEEIHHARFVSSKERPAE